MVKTREEDLKEEGGGRKTYIVTRLLAPCRIGNGRDEIRSTCMSLIPMDMEQEREREIKYRVESIILSYL